MLHGRLGPPPIRTPPHSDDGDSSVVSAAPPYLVSSSPRLISDYKKELPSPTSPLSSIPSSPASSVARPPLPTLPSSHRLSPASVEPSRPHSAVFSDVESLIDGFVSFSSAATEPSPAERVLQMDKGKETSISAEAPDAEEELEAPGYSASNLESAQESMEQLMRMEQRKERPPPTIAPSAPSDQGDLDPRQRSIQEWREQQEREREKARQEAESRATIMPSSSSAKSTGSSSTLSARAQGRPRPTKGPVATETAAQHHFRLAQQHLEAAQRLAMLPAGPSIPGPDIVAASSDFDDGASTSAHSEIMDDPRSPESAYGEREPFEFDHYSLQPTAPSLHRPPQRSTSLSQSSLAPSYVSSSRTTSSSSSIASRSPSNLSEAFYDPPFGSTRFQQQQQQQQRTLPAYPARRPSHSSSLGSQPHHPRHVASYDTFGRDAGGGVPAYQRRDERGEVFPNGESRELAFVPTRPAPSPPGERRPSTGTGGAYMVPRDAFPHPSSFSQSQEPVSYVSEPRQEEEWASQRGYSPSEVSIATTSSPLPMYQPPAPMSRAPPTSHSQSSQAYPPPHSQPNFTHYQHQQPTSYILSPQGVLIPVYSSLPTALSPPPRPTLAVHSRPLQYDHRLPFNSSPVSPQQVQPSQQHLSAALNQNVGPPQGQRSILKNSPSSSDLLNQASTSFSYHATPSFNRPPSIASSSSASLAEDRGLAPGMTMKKASRMASLREKLTSSPHVRFQSPAPSDSSFGSTGKGAANSAKGRDDAVAAMNMTFKMLM